MKRSQDTHEAHNITLNPPILVLYRYYMVNNVACSIHNPQLITLYSTTACPLPRAEVVLHTLWHACSVCYNFCKTDPSVHTVNASYTGILRLERVTRPHWHARTHARTHARKTQEKGSRHTGRTSPKNTYLNSYELDQHTH